MSAKYNKSIKSSYYKASKKEENMKTEYMIIPNPKYASGQECISLTYSKKMGDEFLDNLTAEQLLGPSTFGNRKFAFAMGKLPLDIQKNYSPTDLVVYPAEFLSDKTQLRTPSGVQIPQNDFSNYIVVINGMTTFYYLTYDKFIASILHKAVSLGGFVSDRNGVITTTTGARIKKTANREFGQIG